MICAVLTGAMQIAGFIIAIISGRGDHFFDLFGCLNFVLVIALTFVLGDFGEPRPIYLSALVLISRIWLGAFLQWRVCSRGSDTRVDDLKKDPFVLFILWIMQAFWVYLLLVPVIMVNSGSGSAPKFAVWDAIGISLICFGFFLQLTADLQKTYFRSDPGNKEDFCQIGVWQWSRHPNFFGEILFWWGVYVSAVPVISRIHPSLWLSLCSPVWSMFLLIFVSGLPFAEGKYLARYYRSGRGGQWDEYCERTPPLCLIPCGLYAYVPWQIKVLLCCEFPFLEYSDVTEVRAGPQEVELGATFPE